LRLFGYTIEDLKTIISNEYKGTEVLSSMGNDTPLAVLSDRPQHNYFKQLFAQVTNPPLDGIREEIITDISLAIGGDFLILSLVKVKIQNPVISKEDLDKVRNIDFKSQTIYFIEIEKGVNGLEH
jgi:glutamate synthase (ferredoxin)